jgi:hypothetical protein
MKRGADAGAAKVGIFYRTVCALNPYVYITIAQAAALAHLGNGITINPDFSSDTSNWGDCGTTCLSPLNGYATCDGICSLVRSRTDPVTARILASVPASRPKSHSASGQIPKFPAPATFRIHLSTVR